MLKSRFRQSQKKSAIITIICEHIWCHSWSRMCILMVTQCRAPSAHVFFIYQQRIRTIMRLVILTQWYHDRI